MPEFAANQIAVYDKAGLPLGVLTGWSVTQPRSFRLNEIEDFAFSIPRNDMVTGTHLLTDNVVDVLLRRDNIVYLQNQLISMRGWAGAIRSVSYRESQAFVSVVGLGTLAHKLNTELIEQDDGYVWTIARRLVLAQNAKAAANNDLMLEFLHDETPGNERRNYGHYGYEGDILAGLQGLGNSTLSEFFVHARPQTSGTLHVALRWGGRYVIDNTDIVITDGEGGNILPGADIVFTSDALVSRARLVGAPTSLEQHVDYDSIRGAITNVVPTAELTVDSTVDANHRRREELGLSVTFGYAVETEKALAEQVQERYLGYYKSFLFAYHARLGKPFLEGYDWAGPDGRNDKRLTAHYFRSYRKLAYIGTRTIIVGTTDDDDENNIEARFDDWQFRVNLNVVDNCVGVATDWSDPDQRFIADSTTGNIYELESDLITLNVWQGVTNSGETLRSVATDQVAASMLWVLVTTASSAIVRSYHTETKALISTWNVAVPTANDISVQVADGVIWMVAGGDDDVQARDINSGVLLSGVDYESFASGFASPAGLSVVGDIAYVIDGSGNVRFLFAEDGALAGTKSVGTASNGLFVDQSGGTVWLVRTDGSIDIYRAHIAIGTVDAPGDPDGAPGFEKISTGQFVSVVMTSDKAASPHPRNKYVIVYAKGKYVTTVVETEPGEPDALQRTWVTGPQKVATVEKKTVFLTSPEQVVQGEESRVDDWDPKRDGYGIFDTVLYATKRGHLIRSRGWFFRDWDLPASAFMVDPPEWTEGLAYLQEYLARTNNERTVQVLRVNNRGGLFRKLVLGGKYTVNVTLQGPPGGFSGVLRVLSYTPDELQGVCEVIGEWV